MVHFLPQSSSDAAGVTGPQAVTRPWDELEPLYTINEVAQLTKMSAYWLREQCREGRIAHHRLGRSYRLSRSDVLVLLASTRAQARTGQPTPTRHRRS